MNPNENENFVRDDRSRSNPSQDRESDQSLLSASLVLFPQSSEQKARGYWLLGCPKYYAIWYKMHIRVV